METKEVLRNIFDGFLDSLGITEDSDRFSLQSEKKSRSTSWGRIYDQVRTALYSMDDWAYPLDLYVDDGGKNIFAIVAQSGKLYQVPLSISKDEVSLGDWVQVQEEFTPVEQSFRIRRQKDGRYRWTSIAGTTVLNRVGEIDSSELFDSFVEHAEQTGEYPRLDFYHLGESDPEAYEFGTADFLAREGVCYIASGLFDEDHPLAKATIQAYERDEDGTWGNSVEFYALSKPEILVADPEVKVPVYKKGKNTRISVVLEEDAAGLFTRIGVSTEGVTRTMDEKTKAKLTALYGDDSEGLQAFIGQFEQSVDGVNRTVKDENLIHRAKKDGEEAAAEDAESEENEDENPEFELDDEAMAAIAEQVTQTAGFKTLTDGLTEIKKLVAELVVDRENDKKEIAHLNDEVKRLGKDETEKKTEFLQDLPARKRTVITHRPRTAHDEGGNETMGQIADRTLNGIPAASRY